MVLQLVLFSIFVLVFDKSQDGRLSGRASGCSPSFADYVSRVAPLFISLRRGALSSQDNPTTPHARAAIPRAKTGQGGFILAAGRFAKRARKGKTRAAAVEGGPATAVFNTHSISIHKRHICNVAGRRTF